MAFVVLTKSEVMGMRPRIGLRSHGVPFGGWGSSCGASGQGRSGEAVRLCFGVSAALQPFQGH